MRIGISCYPTYGGSGVVASEVALAMARGGDEVHVISYDLPPRLQGQGSVTFHKVEVRHYPLFLYPPYSLALATKIVEVARTHRLDVLHVHYAVPNAVSAILARQILAPQRLPVVTTLHGTDVTLVGQDPSYLETTRFGVLESDAVTAVSDWLRQVTLDQLHVDRPIDVVPNFLDPARFAPALSRPRDDWGAVPADRAPDHAPVLVHVSNFRRVKRSLDAVEVFSLVARRIACRLVLVGEGPELEAVLARGRELGVAERIESLGNLDAVEDVLGHAALFLLTSEQESFGLAALEALGCGVPVVATAVGGVPEVVRDGAWGLLYSVGDITGMADGAERLLRDPELRRSMGRAGSRFALEAFSRESAVASYREIYRRVITGGPVPMPD